MKCFAVVFVAVAMFGCASTQLVGQTEQPVSNKVNSRVPIVSANTSAVKLGFRLTAWKTIHADTQQQATLESDALKKIGCDVTTENHGGHFDVKYRCPKWKSMKMSTESLRTQWSAWCVAKGMETVEIAPAANTQKATVQFRMPVPKTVHLHDADQASKIITTLKLIGCQVSSNDHGGHTDTTFSCLEWKTIALATEESAHGWQAWLKDSGFETRHTHK